MPVTELSHIFIIQPRKGFRTYGEYRSAFVDVLKLMFAWIEGLPSDKPWAIEVRRHIKKRSNPQNSALWGCAYKFISQETGNAPEDLHQFFCGEFWGWRVEHIIGTKKKKPIRTTTTGEDGKRDVISTEELSEFYESIQRLCAEALDLVVPDPDPDWKTRMKGEEYVEKT
jgi:hypothetical protein|tara:strand:+ start:588 stop:1097 length:510 start_codon:yes stop_codon:yes gene_type:complete